jgi:hypothetical protein
MKKVSKQQLAMETTKDKPGMTVGLDLGDRYSHYCLLNEEGGSGAPRALSGGISRANLVCASRWSAARTRPGSAGCFKSSATR